MTRALLSVALALSCCTAAPAQVVGPLPVPPPPTNQTATLLFEAQLAVSRAAGQTAQNALAGQRAQAAALFYQDAIARYRAGDPSGARFAALRAMMDANAAAAPQPIPALAPLALVAPSRTPLFAGSIPQIDAGAFVAQARGAVAACVAAHDPSAAAAGQRLLAAQSAERAGNWNAARADARDAVNLCAAAQRKAAAGSP